MDLGSRVSLVVKPESVGTIEEYECPNKTGRVFVRLDNGHGYWLHQFALVEEKMGKRKPLVVVGNPYRFPAEWAACAIVGTQFFNDFDYGGACRGVDHVLVAVDCGRVFGPNGYVGRVEE